MPTKTSPRPDWLPYAALFVAALALRSIYLFEWRDTVLASVLLGDGRQYDLWARGIAGGDWFGREVFYQAPFYPYFVAVVYRLFGADPWTLRIVQSFVGAGSCVLLALAGRRFFSREVGLLAGAVLAVYAPAVYFDGLVQKGVLGLFFMSLLLFALGGLLVRQSPARIFAVGLILGAFALTRENALVLPPVVAGWMFVSFGDASYARRAGRVAILVAGLATVLIPVGARNHLLGGRFLVTTSQLGPNFYIGNHRGANGRYVPLRPGRGSVRFERRDAVELAEAAAGRRLDAGEVSRYWLQRALGEIGDEPGSWLRLLAHKARLVSHADEIMDTDSLEVHREASWLLRGLGGIAHFGVLFPLALVGLWATRTEWRRLWLLYALLLSMASAVALFFVMARYRLPLVPILALVAAAGVPPLIRAARSSNRRELGIAAAIFVAAALICNWPVHASIDARAITRYSIGLALIEDGRPEDALGELERALEHEPEFVEALFKLGDALTALDRPQEALIPLREAIRLDPEHSGARVVQGSAWLALGAPEAAEAAYSKAIELDPDSPAAHNNLAVLLARQGRLIDAIPLWERAVLLDPADLESRANLVKVLSRVALMAASCDEAAARNAKEAVRLAERAAELLDRPEPGVLEALAAAYAESGRFEEAVETVRRALELVDGSDAERRTRLDEGLRLYRAAAPLRIPC